LDLIWFKRHLNLIPKFQRIFKFLQTCLLPYSATCFGIVVPSWGRAYQVYLSQRL